MDLPLDRLGWGAALAGLGLIAGSFTGALVVRWPEGRSVVHGRSACDTCGATLRARDLVPLASALLLGGRCRTCRAPIDPVHWRLELAAAAVGAAAGLVAAAPSALAGALFGWMLLALAALDLRHWWLPDRLTATLALAGIASGCAGLAPELADRAIGGAAGFGALWAIAAAYRAARGREGLGGGDPKLLGAVGLWLGWRMLPGVVLLACLLGFGWIAWARVRGHRMGSGDALPFGALLALAAYPAWLLMVGWGG